MTIGIELKTVEDLFVNRYYRIPKYQRKFAWGAEQAQYLYESIKTIEGESYHHYLGQIIIKQIRFSTGDNVYEVIDGQQRLTALVLLLSAIKYKAIELKESLSDDLLYENNSEILEDLINEICAIVRIEKKALKREFNDGNLAKVKLQRTDDSFFQYIVNDNFENIENVNNINKVYSEFVSILDKELCDTTSAQGKIDLIKTIFYKVSKQCNISIIESTNNDEAHKTFETLNNSGVKLEQIDLIKNYIVMTLDDEDAAYLNYWDIYDDDSFWHQKSYINGKSTVLSDFFYFYLQFLNYTNGSEKSSPRDVYSNFKNNLKITMEQNKINEKESLILLIKSFKELNSKYRVLYDMVSNQKNPVFLTKTHRKDVTNRVKEKIEMFVDRLQKVNDIWIVVYWLLSNQEKFNTDINSQSDFLDIIDIFETYIVRKQIVNSSNLNQSLGSFIKTLNNSILKGKNAKKDLISEIYIKTKITKDLAMPSDKQIVDSLTYDFTNEVFLKMVLYALEEEKRKDNGTDTSRLSRKKTNNGKEINLEHIYAKNLVSINDELLASHVGTIGNMLLLAENQNKSIQDRNVFSDPELPNEKTKMSLYENFELHSMKLVQEFVDCYANEQEWTADHIIARSKKVSEQVISLWNWYKYESILTEKEKNKLKAQKMPNNIEAMLAFDLTTFYVFSKKTNRTKKITIEKIDNRLQLIAENNYQKTFSKLEEFEIEIIGSKSKKDYFKKFFIDKDCKQSVQEYIDKISL